MRRLAILIIAAVLTGCAADAPTEEPASAIVPAPPAPAAVPELIDPAIPPAIAGEDGWNFHQSVPADLTGDSQAERVVMTARVELIRGQPAWDDGQPWQVYVESSNGDRTYLYAQRLQLGTLTLRLSQPDSLQRPTVVLLEQLPDRMRILEIDHDAATGSPRTVLRYERMLDAHGDVGGH